jgi:peptide/nickel transport system substrate-binding protein
MMALKSRLIVFVLILSLVSACSGANSATNPQASNGIKYGGAVTIIPGPYGRFVRNFNPFLADNASLSGTRGMIYETLLFFNREKNTINPWLATKYIWSSDLKTLTFTLRQDVNWSDGQAFTSDDVTFTFNLMRQHRELDINSVWTFLTSVTSAGKDQVIFSFKKPATPELWYIGGQSYIVPAHIWKQISDPLKTTNTDPIGSGPFLLKSFDTTLYVLARNSHYWQPGKPYVSMLRYPAYSSNNTAADLLLPQGASDWTGLFSKKLQDNFVLRDPQHNRYWFPPSSLVMLYLNTARYPFTLLPVRQAISLALDRQRLSKEAEAGFELPAHPTGLLLPTHQPYLDPAYRNLTFHQDSNQASALLTAAGFTRGADMMFVDPQGQPLAFDISVVSGWTDWEDAVRIIADNLKSIGIAATVRTMDLSSYLSGLQNGSYESAISWTSSGPSPYFFYYGLLASENSAPLGEQASTNWERWLNPNTDALLTEYAGSNDPQVQQHALSGLQKIMVEQLPAVPLLYAASWYEYTTKRFTGWPSETDNYAVPSPYSYPDAEQVALHLHLNK